MKYIIRKILSMNELSLFTDSHGINESMVLHKVLDVSGMCHIGTLFPF